MCVAGFANGVCDYAFAALYAANCSVAEGGICSIDVDECASDPCMNGAPCSDRASQLARDARESKMLALLDTACAAQLGG